MSLSTKNGLLVVLAVVCGLGFSAKPWIMARAEGVRAKDALREASVDEARMVKDRGREAHLSTELGKEELMRAQGYRRPNEVPFPR